VKKRYKSKPDDSMHMFVGLDVHKKYTEVAILDEDGAVRKQERIQNEHELIEEFSNRLSSADMVMESSSTWYWLYEILSRRHRVVLSHPAKTKAIACAKLKTDKVDALMLANLLRGGFIAESYVPSRRIMSLRELVRYRANLVRMRGSVKNRVHAYLLMNNIKIERSPFTKGFLEELRKVKDVRIEGYIRIIDRLNLEIHEASKKISFEALNDESARLLMTIPGVSYYSALLIVSEIGDGFFNFEPVVKNVMRNLKHDAMRNWLPANREKQIQLVQSHAETCLPSSGSCSPNTVGISG
jgi:transposase